MLFGCWLWLRLVGLEEVGSSEDEALAKGTGTVALPCRCFLGLVVVESLQGLISVGI